MTQWALARANSTHFQHFLHVNPHFLHNRGGIIWNLSFKGSSSTTLISCFTRLVQPNSTYSSQKRLLYLVCREQADVQLVPDHPSSPDKSSCWRSISFLHLIEHLGPSNSLHFIQPLQCSRQNFYWGYPIHSYYPGDLDAFTSSNWYSCLVFDHLGNMLIPSSHLGVGVHHT